MFQQAMKMFSPFGNAEASQPGENEKPKAENQDLKDLKDQLKALQTKLDQLDD